MSLVIDADTHVIESEATWEAMGALGFGDQRPTLLASPDGSGPPYWLFDKRVAAVRQTDATTRTPREARVLADVALRVNDMDKLGVDVQVIYSTFLSQPTTQNESLLAALCRSYNDWIARCCAASDGRLRWAAVLPLLNMHSSLDELKRVKDLGAVAVQIRGFEDGKMLSNPYFLPLYSTAEELDIPICVHTGNGTRELDDALYHEDFAFGRSIFPVIASFNALAQSNISERFPRLRFGFIEAGASWLPYVMMDLEKRIARSTGQRTDISKSFLTSHNFFVACQVSEDLEYVVDRMGSGNLLIGSDYGHADTSSDLEAVRTLSQDPRLSPTDRQRIVSANPQKLYGLG